MENNACISKAEEFSVDEKLINAIDGIHLSGHENQLNSDEGGTGDAAAVVCDNPDRTNDINPLMIDLILIKLMSFLPSNQLQQARLVNSFWNAHAIPYFRVRHRSIELQDDEDLSDFKEVVESAIQFPFGGFDFDDFGKQEKDFLNKFGNHILELSIWSRKFSIHQLQEVFSTCLDLEYFSMRTKPFLTPEADISFDLEEIEMTNLKTLVFRGESDLETKIYNQLLVNQVFKLIPNVKSVRFDCSKEFVPKVFHAMKISALKNLQKLDIQVGVSEDDIKMLSECSGVALKILKLGHVRIKSEHNSLKRFLTSQPSLVELWIYTISYPKNEDGNEPPPFSFPTMPNLKRLSMDEVEQDDDPQLVTFADIDLPKMFPKLEKLEVLEEAFYKYLQLSQPTEILQSLSITNAETTRDKNLQDFFRIRDMFPNMQRLTLEFVTSRWLTKRVFKYLTNLTHLTLVDTDLECCLDCVLTGIPCQRTGNSRTQRESFLAAGASILSYLIRKDRPSLSAMSNLRSLKINHTDGDNEDEVDDPENQMLPKMTDVSVYLALLLIKPLDIFEINKSSADFSDRALVDLKAHHKRVRLF